MSTPTLAGFQSFLYGIMGIPALALPSDSPVIAWVFNEALATVNPLLCMISSPVGLPPVVDLFNVAVYNLAADQLVNYAQDQQGYTYFDALREKYGLNSFAPGVVQSTSDESTSTTLAVPEALTKLTISDLQNLKTPWGRKYLMIAQKMGSNWGVS